MFVDTINLCRVQCAICNLQSALSKCGLSMFLQTVPIDLSMTLRIARICFCLFANVLVLAFAASDVFLVGKTLDSLFCCCNIWMIRFAFVSSPV